MSAVAVKEELLQVATLDARHYLLCQSCHSLSAICGF